MIGNSLSWSRRAGTGGGRRPSQDSFDAAIGLHNCSQGVRPHNGRKNFRRCCCRLGRNVHNWLGIARSLGKAVRIGRSPNFLWLLELGHWLLNRRRSSQLSELPPLSCQSLMLLADICFCLSLQSSKHRLLVPDPFFGTLYLLGYLFDAKFVRLFILFYLYPASLRHPLLLHQSLRLGNVLFLNSFLLKSNIHSSLVL